SVWVRGKVTSGSVRLAVDVDPAFSAPAFYGPTAPTADGIVSLTATGLQPGTRYHYALEDGGVLDTAAAGVFRTHPGPPGEPASYTFGAAGDAGLTGAGDDSHITSAVSDNPVFDTMRAQAAAEEWAWFSHLGDLHYRNIATADTALYRAGYDDTLTFNGTGIAARQGRFYRDVALSYVWDDHDFGPNNSDRTDAGNATANAVFRERVPHYPLAGPEGIYQSWQVGRVLYVASDVRTFRDPNGDLQSPTKTMLGAAQKTWMESVLAADTGAEALVWMTPSRWLADDPVNGDSWNSFQHERAELVQLFGDLGWLTRMIQLTADKHALSISSSLGNPHGQFPIFMFASMDSSFGAPDPVYDSGSIGGRQQYGTVNVSDTGRTISLTGTGWINGTLWRNEGKVITVAAPLISVQFGQLTPPFEPNADDRYTVNKFTAGREEGGEATVRVDEGRLSTQSPPNGVGVYSGSDTFNVASDEQLTGLAAWRVFLGTSEAPRIPSIHLFIAKHLDLADAIVDLAPGDLLTVGAVPSTPDPVTTIVEGGVEEYGPYTWRMELNGSPGPPWTVAQLPGASEVTAGPNRPNRLDTSGSELLAAVGTGDTEWYVHTPQDGVHDRAVWVTSAGPEAVPTEFPFDVRAAGETCRVTAAEPAAWDTFTRSAASSWGASSSGQAWALVGGADTERSVDGTRGVVSWTTAVDTIRFQIAPLVLFDCEVLVRMSADQISTGASKIPGVLLRYADALNFYRARLHFATGGELFASVTRGSVAVGSTPMLPYSYVAGEEFWVRARVIGHRILMRAWPVSAEVEPQTWHIDRTVVTDPIPAGSIGVTASAFSGNTDVARTVRFDDFAIVTPQRMTVQRALNGVVKAHDAGVPVALAQPMHLAL
ncbi:MAG: alkaline phosphatase D family protein, partial [Pseudonocardia sp.]